VNYKKDSNTFVIIKHKLKKTIKINPLNLLNISKFYINLFQNCVYCLPYSHNRSANLAN